MASSKRSINTTSVSMAGTTITGVTNFAADQGGQTVKFAGDGDRFNTTVVQVFAEPTLQVTTADLNALRTLVPGTRGVFTATINDSKSGITAAGGGFTVTTASNTAIVENNPFSAAHRTFGTGTISIVTESADGVTNPISFVTL